MVKGFISFRNGKIPFVIENYRMELFTDDSLLDDFCKEYNFKENYILHGQCFDIGIRGRNATFLVENSMGSTCYLRSRSSLCSSFFCRPEIWRSNASRCKRFSRIFKLRD